MAGAGLTTVSGLRELGAAGLPALSFAFVIAALFALKTPLRSDAVRDCSPSMQHSQYLAVQRGLVAMAHIFRNRAKDQHEQQHFGLGQGLASSSAVHQDSEDSHTFPDSMSEVRSKYASHPWPKVEMSGVPYFGVSLDKRIISKKTATTPEPKKMQMAPTTLPQAPVQAALKAPPPIVEHIDQQLAAALACMTSCGEKYEAAKEKYAATYISWKAANSKILNLHCQRHGEPQSKRQKTRG